MNPLSLLIKNFSLESEYLRFGIRVSVACFLVVILYTAFALPDGYWAAFSVVACTMPTLGNSLQRTRHRLIGTFIGMWIAILLVYSFGFNRIILDILLPIFIFLTFYLKAYSYGLFATCTTIVTVLFVSLITPGDWSVAIIRLVMTVGGYCNCFAGKLIYFALSQQRSTTKKMGYCESKS